MRPMWLRVSALAPLVLSIVVAAACHSGDGDCGSTSCGGGSGLSYQSCSASDGSKSYSFNGQSCNCPTSDPQQCSDCAASVQLFCEGVSGDGGNGDSGSSSG